MFLVCGENLRTESENQTANKRYEIVFGKYNYIYSQKMNNSFVYSIAYIQKHSEYFKTQKILNFPEFGSFF